MPRRLARVLVFSLLVVVLVAVQGVPLASGEESDEELVGYTFGLPFTDGSAAPEAAGTPGDVGAEQFFLCNFYEVELESGELTQLNPAGTEVPCADGLTFDDDGDLYGYRENPSSTGIEDFTQLVEIDLDDGSQELIGNLPAVLVGAGGMAFDAEGDLWLYGHGSKDPECFATGEFNCLWEVDARNAHSEFVGATAGRLVTGLTADCEDVIGISVASDLTGAGEVAPLIGVVGPTQLDEVDTSDAGLEKIASTPGVEVADGLDFDGDGDLWAIGSLAVTGTLAGAQLYEIDPENGHSEATTVTLAGVPFEGLLFGLGISPIECPEPEPPAPQPTPVVVEPTFTG